MELTAEKIPAVTVRRSRWVTAAMILQTLWALTLIGLVVYLLLLARGKTHEAIIGLMIAAGSVAFPGVLAAMGGVGLWGSKRWGWWLTEICDWGIVAMLIYAMIDDATDGLFDWSIVGTTLVAMVVPVLLLTPVIRKHYHRPQSATSSV